jgi:hypothetical protein
MFNKINAFVKTVVLKAVEVRHKVRHGGALHW